MIGRPTMATRNWWLGAAGLGAFLALWQVGAWRYNPVVLPSPLATAGALVELALSGELARALIQTTARALAGFGLGLLIGVSTGLAAGLYPAARALVWPVVTVLQGIPPIAWIVLALIWFGVGGGSAIFTVAVISVPLVFVATMEGARTTDRGLLEMARVFQVPPRVLLLDVYLPSLLSVLFPALVAGLALAWKVAVMAEVLGADGGIGAGLALARVNVNTARALAWITSAVLLMLAFEHLMLHPVRRWLEPWRTGSTPSRRSASSSAVRRTTSPALA